MEEIVFKEFYEDILKDAVRALEKRMADWSVYVEDSVYSDFSEYLAGRLQSIGIRGCWRAAVRRRNIHSFAGRL